MEESQCLCVKRRGLKGSITKLTGKVQEALTAELETVNRDSIPESRKLLVSTAIAQLKSKLEQIIELDGAIAKTIQEEGELETEILDADTYQTNLEQQIAVLVEFTKKANQLPMVQGPTLPLTAPDRTPPRLTSAGATTESE